MKNQLENAKERAPHKLKKLIDRAGIPMSQVARDAGFATPSGLARYINADEYRQNYFKPDLVEKLIDALVGWGDPPITAAEVAELGGRFTTFQKKDRKMPSPGLNHGPGWQDRSREFLDEHPYVPVYGRATGSNEAVAFNAAQITEYVRAHPALEKVRDGFAIRYFGGSMEPRYEANEIVYLHPTRKPVKGQDCVIVLFGDSGPDTAVLKRYENEDSDYIYCLQLNPKKQVRFEKTLVHKVFVVVGRG